MMKLSKIIYTPSGELKFDHLQNTFLERTQWVLSVTKSQTKDWSHNQSKELKFVGISQDFTRDQML